MVELHVLDTGKLKLDGGAMFGVVPKVLWNKIYPADENNQVTLVMRCLLAITGNRKVLIDTGIGNKMDPKKADLYFLEDIVPLEKLLAGHNVKPDEITDVVLTHLHFDHCGGSVVYDSTGKAVPAFKNATYHVGEKQWEAAIKPNKRERASYFPENFMSLKEEVKLHLIDQNSTLCDDIELRLFHGHTAGQLIPFIHYKNRTLVYIADVIPAAANIPLSWITAYDMQPLTALEEKEAFLTEAEKKSYILFFEHDMYNECCTLQKTEKGIRAAHLFRLSDLT